MDILFDTFLCLFFPSD